MFHKTTFYLVVLICLSNDLIFCQNFFPLEVGNLWTYEIYYNNVSDGLHNYVVTKDSTFSNGKKYYFISNMDNAQLNYVRVDSDFVYFYDVNDSVEVAAYKLNASPNETWNANISIFMTITFGGSQKEILFNDSTLINIYSLDGLSTGEMELSKDYGPIYSVNNGDPGVPLVPVFKKILRGCIISGKKYGTTVDIEENLIEQPDYILLSNFPNPFNPTTTIRYNLPSSGFVRMTVYNPLGQKIRTLINGYCYSGIHNIKFDGSNLASSLYIILLETSESVRSHKIILQK